MTARIVCPHCDAINAVPPERDARDGKCGKCSEALFTGQPIALTGSRLARHAANSDLPVVIDFWAGWCGPCRQMAPIFERAAAELEPKARFVKVDVDANPEAARQYHVRGIPALFVVKGGKVTGHHAGVADMAMLRRWVEG